MHEQIETACRVVAPDLRKSAEEEVSFDGGETLKAEAPNFEQN